MKTSQIVTAILAGTLALSACALSPPYSGQTSKADGELYRAAQDKSFNSWLTHDLYEQVKANPDYNRIPLDTRAQQSEFTGWLHDLYRKGITPQQFKQQVLEAYPGHEYEVDFIISCLP